MTRQDFKPIHRLLDTSGIRTIRATGGEPSLHIPLLKALTKYLAQDIGLECVTNAQFASSAKKCSDILTPLKRLTRLFVSYDIFHAKFVPIANLIILRDYCADNNIAIAGFSVISQPHDILTALDYEQRTGITFHYQKVLPVGRALANGLEYRYAYFEHNVLKSKCPNLSSLLYIPSLGVTHCCSTQLYRGTKHTLDRIIKKDVHSYTNSRFYKLTRNLTFDKLLDMRGLKQENLSPACSQICELCRQVLPPLL